MPDARAVRLWEKIRQNLIDRDMFSFDQDDDLDAEQIKTIEYELGVEQELIVYGAPDSTTIQLKIDKAIPSAPVIEAISGAFFKTGGKAHVKLGEALTVEFADGRLKIAKRPKTW